jgi:hypothetical protein
MFVPLLVSRPSFLLALFLDKFSPLAVLFLLVLVFLALLVLWIQAVRQPYRIIQIRARLSRAMMRTTCGDRWEEVLKKQRRNRYLEYLQKAPQEPQKFSSRAREVRVVFILFSIATLFMLMMASIMLLSSLLELLISK